MFYINKQEKTAANMKPNIYERNLRTGGQGAI